MTIKFGEEKQKKRETTTTVIPAATDPSEVELRKLNLEFAKRQLAQMDTAIAEADAARTDPTEIKRQELAQRATEALLNRVTGKAPVLSPEEEARLNTVYGATQKTGEEDLMRFATELAAMRGMAPADSPIGNEVLRQRTRFGENLAGQKAAASLDLGQSERLFNQSLAEFQARLREQAFQNRLAIAGQAPASYGLQSSLFAERAAGASRFGRGSGFGSTFGYGLSGADVAGYGKGFYDFGGGPTR